MFGNAIRADAELAALSGIPQADVQVGHHESTSNEFENSADHDVIDVADCRRTEGIGAGAAERESLCQAKPGGQSAAGAASEDPFWQPPKIPEPLKPRIPARPEQQLLFPRHSAFCQEFGCSP